MKNPKLSRNFSFWGNCLNFNGKSGPLTAFSKAGPAGNEFPPRAGAFRGRSSRGPARLHKISVLAAAILCVLVSPVFSQQNVVKPAIADKDLVIPLSDVSENAVFYPVDIEGTRLEVLAVKAPDGTIRTAFNTCQVCYASGRGYYKQQGTVLVCQNCGNRFRMSQVGQRSGGCNPVPISAANKTVTDSAITISKNFLTEAKVIFARWRRG